MRTSLSSSDVINNSTEYIASLFRELQPENLLKMKSRLFADELGLGGISLSQAEGLIISMLIQLSGCHRFVEVGTLTGLSAQYILDGLGAGGELWTIEKSQVHGEKSDLLFNEVRKNGHQVNLIIGDAREELEKLSSLGPFDGIFIDGNKSAYVDYLDWAEKNIRKNGLIIADNVFLFGSVWDSPQSKKVSPKQIKIMQELNRRLADSTKYKSSLIPTSEGLFVAQKLF